MKESSITDSDDSDRSNSDSEAENVLDYGIPFRFILGEEAQALLDGIAYGRNTDGKYFSICKDGDEVSGLIIDGIIRHYIKKGILSRIPKNKNTA